MHCGIILTGDTDDDSSVAFLSEGDIETSSVSTNDGILELLEEKRPEVTALNAPPKREKKSEFRGSMNSESSLDPETAKQFRQGEEDLIDEGHAMLPQGMRESAVLERADHLSRSIEASGIGTTIIETNARLASDILGLQGDEDLERLGVDASGIETVWEYDAVVLAFVAKLYSENRCEDHGIVVPEEGVKPI